MDALILSCGTGGGHNSACEALKEELSSRGHGAKMLNPYLLKGSRTAETVNNAYNLLAQKAPSAFGVVYRLGNAYRRLPVSSPVYLLNKGMVPLFEDYLSRNRCDAIVSTHLFPAEIVTYMKRQGRPVPKTYFVATDYTCIPFTEETDCDYYIIPSKELVDEFVDRGIPRERIVPLGIPVRKCFREAEGRFEAKRRLGLDPCKMHILIAGGSMGAGQIEQIVPLLLEHYGDEVKIIVICGSNKTLYDNLSKEQGDRCILYGYTDKMAELMRACDLFLSKPGGLSSTEAAVSGAALIHITPIPGCETRNMEFFEKYGMSLAVNAPKKQLADACDRLLDEGFRRKMRENQIKTVPQNAAGVICDFLEEVCGRT